jgi:hypothetical protein
MVQLGKILNQLTSEDVGDDGYFARDRHITPQEAEEEPRHGAFVEPLVANDVSVRRLGRLHKASITHKGWKTSSLQP